MDLSGAIDYIARSEARRVRPITDEEELGRLDAEAGRCVPVLDVSRDARGRLAASGRLRCGSHDNADRLPFMVDWLNRCVLPLVEPEAAPDVCGAWRVELHDSYSYLPERRGYREVLTFGRAPDAAERRVALLPDPYHIGDFGGLLRKARTGPAAVPWAAREPTLFFAGTTTGDRDPSRNERVRACVWALDDAPAGVACMHITNVAQMTAHDISNAWGERRTRGILAAPAPVHDHFRYRYQANIVGNTACWSRLPMVMSSGSLLVHVRHADAVWYYPLLREREHYVAADSVDGADLLRAHAWCRANDAECERIAASAAALAGQLFAPSTAASYAATLLQEAGACGRA